MQAPGGPALSLRICSCHEGTRLAPPMMGARQGSRAHLTSEHLDQIQSTVSPGNMLGMRACGCREAPVAHLGPGG